jgi:hypothetical protein
MRTRQGNGGPISCKACGGANTYRSQSLFPVFFPPATLAEPGSCPPADVLGNGKRT